MHTTKILLICGLLTCASAQADIYEWTSGWGMGVSEHLVDDGNGNELNISCPDYKEDDYVRAYATIGGRQYSSEKGSGFDVIVDGETYSTPFFTTYIPKEYKILIDGKGIDNHYQINTYYKPRHVQK